MPFLEKVQFFEEKYKEEASRRKDLEENMAKIEETNRKIAKEKALLEQELSFLKSNSNPYTFLHEHSRSEDLFSNFKETNTINNKILEKSQKANEDLKRQLTALQEKTQKYSKEIQTLKRKLDEKDNEINKLNESLQLRNRKSESNYEELEALRIKASSDEKTLKTLYKNVKEELDLTRRENELLKSKISDLQRENTEILHNSLNVKNNNSKEKFDFSNLEERIREKNEEISNKDIKIARLEKSLKMIENDYEQKTNEIQSLLKEKRDMMQKISVFKRKNLEFKENVSRNIYRKFEIVKKEAMELKIFFKKNLKNLLNDLNLQANFSCNLLKAALHKRELKHEEDRTMDSEINQKLKELQRTKKNLENELQNILLENENLKKDLLNNKNVQVIFDKEKEIFLSKEIENLKEENSQLQKENTSLKDKILVISTNKGDKNEENKKLYNELMQLRGAIDTLYTKHKQILEEVTLDIEKLKEKQTEEISHINQNYTEMINVMTEKLEFFKRDENNKSTNMFKMSQRIEHLEKVNKELEIKLNYSGEVPTIDNPVKSYESPSLKSGRVDNSRLLQNKSLGDIYENLDGKEKSQILELDYYGPSNTNKNIYYSSISRDNDPGNLSQMIMNDDKKIKQFSNQDNFPNTASRVAQLTQKEVDELKNLLAYTYKNVADNTETTKKFMEEADNLTDKVKELQKMHEFIGNSSFIKKYHSMAGLHKASKSHDSPEFPNYTEKLAQLYSPISVKRIEDDQIKETLKYD